MMADVTQEGQHARPVPVQEVNDIPVAYQAQTNDALSK